MTKLKVRKYRDRDKEAILSWFKHRGTDLDEAFLGKVGFIVPGIAAGFIIQTDTKACIFEPFVSNPDTFGPIRDEALNMIMERMINEAKDLGYYRVFGFASHNRMVSRALRCGFVKVEDSITVCKDLT